ncbi:unnamed protein product [Commensalibacter papalotli (ex Botero et al. 2024)]|uniref:Beta-lactamase n=1 Tax=Commensalibacter papalotli (ex Botero et al. 2024) TaxID=2972766 RepID=A0ABM9HKH7_9PROT|nr:unnamed protein product [Commensalibacter papalotli (ex Botero et al. 2024)]CAI3947595.1 unnamed protein product [Commensalibacter papalotli (ex Botero et al. 2024)]
MKRDVKNTLNFAQMKRKNSSISSTQYNLGLKYKIGDGIKKDYFEAVKCSTKAANQCYTVGNYNIGVIYTNIKYLVKLMLN